jgi:DNA-binding NarL/FixJ family response regulator
VFSTPLAVLEKRNLIKVSPDQNSIRILAVDDHPQFREGIAVVLATQPDMDLVAQACNGHEAIQQFHTHCPDITLMDLQVPGMNGLDAMTAIRREFPEARIIVLTTFENDLEIQLALQAGACTYILKSLLPSRIMDVIRRVHAGEKGFIPG